MTARQRGRPGPVDAVACLSELACIHPGYTGFVAESGYASSDCDGDARCFRVSWSWALLAELAAWMGVRHTGRPRQSDLRGAGAAPQMDPHPGSRRTPPRPAVGRFPLPTAGLAACPGAFRYAGPAQAAALLPARLA